MKLKFRAEGNKVLGAGDWWVEHEESRNTMCTGLWEDGKVIALLVTEGIDAMDSDLIRAKGDAICLAVNSHDMLVDALKRCVARMTAELPDPQDIDELYFALKVLANTEET